MSLSFPQNHITQNFVCFSIMETLLWNKVFKCVLRASLSWRKHWGDYPKGREEALAPTFPGCIHFQTQGTGALGTQPLCWCLLSCFLKAGAQLHTALSLLYPRDAQASVHHPHLPHNLLATWASEFRCKSGSCSFEIYFFT